MYGKEKLQENVDEIDCRVCFNDQETVSHILCGRSKMAQTLHKNRHDRMLRPLYHSIQKKYEFSESENSLPWYEQSHPVPCLENDKAKILWDIPWHLEKCPRNGAKKPDMSMLDKMNKEWYITEGTVCVPRTIPARTMFKRDKYADLRLGVKSLYPGHKVSSVQVVFDFLAAHSINLAKELADISQDKKAVGVMKRRHRNG